MTTKVPSQTFAQNHNPHYLCVNARALIQLVCPVRLPTLCASSVSVSNDAPPPMNWNRQKKVHHHPTDESARFGICSRTTYYNYTFSERLFVSARCSIGNSLRDSRTDLWHRHRTRPSRVSLGERKEVSVGKIGIEWSFELSEARQFVMFACSCNFLTFIALLLSKWHPHSVRMKYFVNK